MRPGRLFPVLLALLAMALPSLAETFKVPETPWNPRVSVCPRTSAALTIDGLLDEPAWVATPFTDDFVDIRGKAAGEPRYRTHAKLLWNDTWLYIGAELFEPHVWATLTARDAVIYHDNDFEVFLDPDGDNHDYYELEINALNTVWDLLLVKPYRDGGPAVNGWDIHGLQTAVFVDGKLNDVNDLDRRWTVEIAIPWSALKDGAGAMACPPRAGDTWRLNFSRVEWQTGIEAGRYVKRLDPQGKPLPEDNWVWSPQGLVAMHYPERWGFLQFSGVEAGGKQPAGTIPTAAVPGSRYLMPLYYAERLYQERHGYFANTLEQLPLGDADRTRLTDYRERGDLMLQATPWQFEARLTVSNRIHHVDDTGRLWITAEH